MLRLIKRHPLSTDRRGMTAVEFALILPMLLPMLLGTIEISMMFVCAEVLESAIVDGGRLVRTGQAADAPDPLDAFRTEFCNSLAGVIDCDDVWFEVQEFPTFGDINMDLPLDEDGNPAGGGFDIGDSSSIMVVRAAYRFRFVLPFLGQIFTDNGTNSRLLVSTTVFRNEPYDVDWS